MNVTKLFLREGDKEALSHVRSEHSVVTRTASDLLHNVCALSARLRSIGVRAGDNVLILCGSRVEAVESILASIHLGATAMPVSPLLGAVHLETIITRMRPSCCVFEDAPEPAVIAALGRCAASMILLKPRNSATPAHWHCYRDLLADPRAVLEFPDFPDEQRALIIHSSGSSGSPKGVAMSHGEVQRFFEYHNFVYSQYSDGPDTFVGSSPVLTGLPMNHLAGLGTCLQGLMSGRPAHLLSFFLPDVYLRLIERVRCSFIMLVPSLYRSLLNEPYLKKTDLSALRFCITGGEPCPVELMERIEAAFGVPLVSAYSMTECLSGIGHSRRELFGRHHIPHGSCGRQLFGELKLMDAQGNESSSFGELWVRNATVHECYLDAELNETRLSGGWFRTRDLFFRDDAGEFFHRGRADDMFICNGKNIYPIEVESVLMRHPAVEIACAAPVSHAVKGTVPAAFIVARQPLSETEIVEFSMKHGPSHTVPQIVLVRDSVAQLAAGKIDRREAARQLQEACDAAAA